MNNLKRLEDARSILHQGKSDYNAFLAIADENSILHYQGAELPLRTGEKNGTVAGQGTTRA